MDTVTHRIPWPGDKRAYVSSHLAQGGHVGSSQASAITGARVDSRASERTRLASAVVPAIDAVARGRGVLQQPPPAARAGCADP